MALGLQLCELVTFELFKLFNSFSLGGELPGPSHLDLDEPEIKAAPPEEQLGNWEKS